MEFLEWPLLRGCVQVEESKSTSLVDNDVFKTPPPPFPCLAVEELKDPSGDGGYHPLTTPNTVIKLGKRSGTHL